MRAITFHGGRLISQRAFFTAIATLCAGCQAAPAPSRTAPQAKSAPAETANHAPLPPSVAPATQTDSDAAPDAETASEPTLAASAEETGSLDFVDGGSGGGKVFFRENDRRYYLIALGRGAPRSLSDALDRTSKGADDAAGISRNGRFVALVTQRFGCGEGNCVAIASGDGSKASLVRHAGGIARGFARPAVGNRGDLIVVPSRGGAHSLDLYVLRRSGDAWLEPRLLTRSSRSKFNQEPALSADEQQVAFDCGDDPYSVRATSLCRVGIDGKGLEVVLTPEALPGGKRSNAIHHPAWDPRGGLVFEADVGGERIWRLPSGSKGASKAATPIASAFSNDNTPCTFSDGRIASLWLGRAGNDKSAHELKIMGAEGSPHVMPLPGLDILDVGLDCVD